MAVQKSFSSDLFSIPRPSIYMMAFSYPIPRDTIRGVRVPAEAPPANRQGLSPKERVVARARVDIKIRRELLESMP